LQFELLVCNQLDAIGLEVTNQLQSLLLSVAEEQADGCIVYSDAIVDAGESGSLLLLLFACESLKTPQTLLLLFSSAIRIHGHRSSFERFGRLRRIYASVLIASISKASFFPVV
jgi:hypothetical protein